MRADAVGIGAWVLGLSILGLGCGAITALPEEDGALRCNPGEVRNCACSGGERGKQSCGPDRRFADCICGDAGTDGDGAPREDDEFPGPIGGGPDSSGKILCGVMRPVECAIEEGERCCILEPGLDYCFGPNESCACKGPNCRATIASCDGPEDCPSGTICCGRFENGGYASIGCRTSCSAENERELCHPGGEGCSRAGQRCSRSASLPEGYFRCE